MTFSGCFQSQNDVPVQQSKDPVPSHNKNSALGVEWRFLRSGS